jgi:hypothetical protein
MCLSKPKLTAPSQSKMTPSQPEVTRYQQSKEPVARQAARAPLGRTSQNEHRGGRRGTILAPMRVPGDVLVSRKKTALGA